MAEKPVLQVMRSAPGQTSMQGCDCLNWCGDDERRIRDGKVQPCDAYVKRKLQENRLKLVYQLLNELGHGADTLAALLDLQAMRGQRTAMVGLLRKLLAAVQTIDDAESTEEAGLLNDLVNETQAMLAAVDGQTAECLFTGRPT